MYVFLFLYSVSANKVLHFYADTQKTPQKSNLCPLVPVPARKCHVRGQSSFLFCVTTILRKGKDRELSKKSISTIAYFESFPINSCEKESYFHLKKIVFSLSKVSYPCKIHQENNNPTASKFCIYPVKAGYSVISTFLCMCRSQQFRRLQI